MVVINQKSLLKKPLPNRNVNVHQKTRCQWDHTPREPPGHPGVSDVHVVDIGAGEPGIPPGHPLHRASLLPLPCLQASPASRQPFSSSSPPPPSPPPVSASLCIALHLQVSQLSSRSPLFPVLMLGEFFISCVSVSNRLRFHFLII